MFFIFKNHKLKNVQRLLYFHQFARRRLRDSQRQRGPSKRRLWFCHTQWQCCHHKPKIKKFLALHPLSDSPLYYNCLYTSLPKTLLCFYNGPQTSVHIQIHRAAHVGMFHTAPLRQPSHVDRKRLVPENACHSIEHV